MGQLGARVNHSIQLGSVGVKEKVRILRFCLFLLGFRREGIEA